LIPEKLIPPEQGCDTRGWRNPAASNGDTTDQGCSWRAPEAIPGEADQTTMNDVGFQVRHATEADLPAIVDIYNQSIPGGWSTADTEPVTVADRVEWFRKFDPARRPIWVAEIDMRVAAWASLSSFYGGRPAYNATAELSLYIATAYHRRGIGKAFKRWVIEQCPPLGVTTLLSMHFDHNEATRRINESLGFVP
jgi:phosphinothricin acetyltransferase